MTIDDAITALQCAKKELGGDTKYCLHVHCNGNADVVEIKNIVYSKIFGLKSDIAPTWWMYKR